MKQTTRSKRILESARGQKCTVCSPWCNHNTETTVWAHSNMSIHGKGLGRKAHDIFGCYACSECHRWLDEGCHRWLDEGPPTRQEKELVFFEAFSRSLLILIEEGIVSIKK